MTGPALSTMWAQQARFERDFDAFAEVARGAGFAGIEVSHSTRQDGLDALLRSDILPVPSLHAPAPFTTSHRGNGNSGLNLASLDEEERQEAVAHHLRTIAYAGDHSVGHVVVHLGGLPGLLPGERALRSLYNAGRLADEAAAIAREQARQTRAETIAPHVDAARRSLETLAEAAARRGVVLGLENRLHYHEIPSADETPMLLAPYPRTVAGYWHDTGHAEVQSRLGLIDARATLAALAPLLVGCHLHDVRGIADHRAPGNGDVDWSYIAAALSGDIPHTLEIDQREPESSLADALRFLRARGLTGAPSAALETEPR